VTGGAIGQNPGHGKRAASGAKTGSGSSAIRVVPVLFVGREPHHIAGPDFLDGTAVALSPAAAPGFLKA